MTAHEQKALPMLLALVLIASQACPALRQVLCFIDLGGHERYLKTAVYGLTCMLPDVVLLCVSARAPPPRAAQPGSPGGWGTGDPEGPAGRAALLPRAAREHLAVALALDVPVAVVITQVLRTGTWRASFWSARCAVLLSPLWHSAFLPAMQTPSDCHQLFA